VPEQVTASTADQAPRRRGRPGYDLEAVLRAAVEVFNERGYDGASMEDLSKRLGIAKSGIYHHVSGKEELLRMALDRALDGLWEAADRARTLDAPAIVRLETLVRDAIAVLDSRLPYVTLLLRVRGNTDVERAALARRRAFDALVASLVEEAERDGDIRAGIDPKHAARLLFGTVNSIVEWYRPSSSTGVPASDLADAVCAITFDGLRVRAGRELGSVAVPQLVAGVPQLVAAAAELGDKLVTTGDGDVVDAVATVTCAQASLGDQDVAAAARRDEDDVGARRQGDRAPAVAGAGEGCVGEGEDHAPVADVVPVDHVVPDGQLGPGPALPVGEQLDAEHPRGGVGGQHRLDGTGLDGTRLADGLRHGSPGLDNCRTFGQ
jgi:AcrR family transcriptional regulator